MGWKGVNLHVLLVVMWLMVLSLVTATICILLPGVEHRMREAFVEMQTHRPLESYRHFRYLAKMEELQSWLDMWEKGGYEAVFLSMYSLESFEEEDFHSYRGVDTLKIDLVFENALELQGALSKLLACHTQPQRIYLGIDPMKLERHLLWERELDWQASVAAFVEEQEEIEWEMLLAYPSFGEWQSMTEEGREQGIAGYGRAMEALTSLENLLLFYVGDQEWLICNEQNYVGEGVLNASVTHRLFLHIFCDQGYRVTADNLKERLRELEETLGAWRQDPPFVKERSDVVLVFLGDSMFGNYTDSTGVPGVVENFTKARCINCGYGGICLAQGMGDISGMDVITNLCSGQVGNIPKEKAAYDGIQEFAGVKTDSGRLVFILNYGVNDYLFGNTVSAEDKYMTTSYLGAMRTAVEQLRASYPDAEILILTPGYITFQNCGTEIVGENGALLEEYVEAALQVAREYDLPSINMYAEMEAYARNEKILTADGVHPNEQGRFFLGMKLCEKLNVMAR